MKSNVDLSAFFLHIGPYEEGFFTQAVRLLAARISGRLQLVKGRMHYHNRRVSIVQRCVETNSILAGEFDLCTLGIRPDELAVEIMEGRVPSPWGDIDFNVGESGSFLTSFNPFHQEGIDEQKRISILEIRGEDHPLLERTATLSWELMAASTPYVHVNELASDFQLGHLQAENSVFEFVALHVAEIDRSSSVRGERADIGVLISKTLDRKKVRIGYRVVKDGQTSERSALQGETLNWQETEGEFASGFGSFQIPPQSVVQAFAIYNDSTQHFWWLSDREHMPNERRAIYELYDAELAVMTEIFTKPLGRGNAHDLEAAVSWLLWILGFEVALLGNTTRTQDAPDVIALTPSGHVVVIECTTGILKTDNKLSHLVSRSHQIQERLVEQGAVGVSVLPVIVTTKSRGEISIDLEQAERHGVLVVAREDLIEAIPRTLGQPDADGLFVEAERVANSNRAKYLDI